MLKCAKLGSRHFRVTVSFNHHKTPQIWDLLLQLKHKEVQNQVPAPELLSDGVSIQIYAVYLQSCSLKLLYALKNDTWAHIPLILDMV